MIKASLEMYWCVLSIKITTSDKSGYKGYVEAYTNLQCNAYTVVGHFEDGPSPTYTPDVKVFCCSNH